jgi:hypothetical protein
MIIRELISNQHSYSDLTHYCWLGLSNSASCWYNPINPPIFFSLGDIVAALAIFITAWQLTKPWWELVLSIRKWWQKYIIWVSYALSFLLHTPRELGI